MIEDDADPETLDAWYRRTPDEIEAAKRAKWNAEWAALRLPDHLAYEPENAAATLAAQAAAGQATDAAATVGRAVRPSRPVPPPKNDWANHELGFLDVLASGETKEGNLGFDVLATRSGQPTRRLASGPDGKPDYSKFPNDPLKYPNAKGTHVINSSAGRYQFKTDPWRDIVKAHPDVTDFTPLNQNKAAWYLATRDYRTRTHGRDLSADLRDERNWTQVARNLKDTWSSLPGGDGQQMSQEEFNARLRAAIERYRDPHPDD